MSFKSLVFFKGGNQGRCMLHQQGSVLGHTSLKHYSCQSCLNARPYINLIKRWSVYPSIYSLSYFFLWQPLWWPCCFTSTSSGGLHYLRGQKFAPSCPCNGLMRRIKKKIAPRTLSSFVIFFSSAPSESTFLTCLNLLVIVAAKAVLVCLPEKDRHQRSSSLVSYLLRPPLSHRITCVSQAFDPTWEWKIKNSIDRGWRRENPCWRRKLWRKRSQGIHLVVARRRAFSSPCLGMFLRETTQRGST